MLQFMRDFNQRGVKAPKRFNAHNVIQYGSSVRHPNCSRLMDFSPRGSVMRTVYIDGGGARSLSYSIEEFIDRFMKPQ